MSERVLARRRLANTDSMIVEDIGCAGGSPRWTPVAADEGYAVILVRAGAFRRQAAGQDAVIDPSGGLVSVHGVEERWAYPAGGTQRVTLIGLTREAHDEHLHDLVDWRLRTDTEFDVRHRAMLAACARGADRFEITERLLGLLGSLSPREDVPTGRRPGTEAAHRRLADSVLDALSGGHLTAGLPDLAALVGASPAHLSRTFRRVTGRTLTHYRNELRVRAVLEDLTSGAESLVALAARYGFTDQAHLTRIVRRHANTTPGRLRTELSTKVQAST
ncbi:helix-turn-helix transcriptional regulator [Actinophytocola sp.]|uniref:helix-turn-helix domain-containing protein n=1 Tax=Actinophytocola sp. TaxID=1872138 RepID=UPI0025BCD56E|nr:helix-turn-helix transcriptional regulator [Actinophytocola sp.]